MVPVRGKAFRRFGASLGWLRPVGLCVLCAQIALVACVNEYDFERRVDERGSLGTEVFRVFRRDAPLSVRAGLDRASLLDRERVPFISSVDAIAPEPILRDLDFLLRDFNVLHDRGLTPEVTRRFADILDDCVADESMRRAWERDNARPFASFQAADVHSALLEQNVAFPKLRALMQLLSKLVLENDGLDLEGNPDPSEPNFIAQLNQILASSLATAEVDPDPDRTEMQFVEVLLQDHPDFATPNTPSLFAVRLDRRGLPVVRSIPGTEGRLFSPFVDADGDGLADINDARQFIDFDGNPIDIVPFAAADPTRPNIARDELGRFVVDGQPVYAYIDLNATAAAFLTRDSTRLLEDGTAFDLVYALNAIMPARTSMRDEELNLDYMGYPLDHPVAELTHAGLQILTFEQTDELLDVSHSMIVDHPSTLAELFLALQDFDDLRTQHPNAALRENNTLLDDLFPIIEEILSHEGLLAEVLRALSDDIALHLASTTLDLLKYKGRVTPDPTGPYETCFASCESSLPIGTEERLACIQECPREEVFSTRMDHSAPPSLENRSHFERTVALLREASGLEFALSVTRLNIPDLGTEYDIGPDVLPPLVKIDDAGAAFMDAVAGNLDLTELVTPEAVAHPQVALLVDGIGLICNNENFFGRFAAGILPALVRVTEVDLERTCNLFNAVDDIPDLDEDGVMRNKIAVMASFLSLLTDVPLDVQPSVRQLTRFFNLQNPELNLEIAQISLSQLIDKDGYYLWENNGDMLYAAEASGALDVLYPIVKVFSDRGLSGLFVSLLEVLHNHYSPPGVTYPMKDGTPSPTLHTGIRNYEPLIADWLEQGRIVPALHRLSTTGNLLTSKRGTAFPELAEGVGRHLFTPDVSITTRAGLSSTTRNDGVVVEPIHRAHLLRGSLRSIDDLLSDQPEALNRWDRAVDSVVDTALGVKIDSSTNQAVWVNPGGVAVSHTVLDHLSKRAATLRDSGLWVSRVEETWTPNVEDVLSGPTLPAAIDLLLTLDATPEDRELMIEFMVHNVEHGSGASDLMVKLYTLFLELTVQEDFVIAAHFYGKILDPSREYPSASSKLPLLSLTMHMLREADQIDTEALALGLIRNSLTRHPDLLSQTQDPQGEYPISVLGRILRDYNRTDPTLSSADPASLLHSDDYAQICSDVRDWLRDDRKGMEQIYDLVKIRKR